jgi:isocitrate/isopropylmalate dehydrogenase
MKVAMLPGDGIGTEIVAEAAKVLERLRSGLQRGGTTASRADARHRAAR